MSGRPVVSSTTPQTPLIDKATGQVTFTWLKWFQGVQQIVNSAFDQQGNFDGNLGPDASISTRNATLLVILHNIDDTGVATANGIDFSRAYLNKNTDHINDGSGSPLAGGKVAFAAMVTAGPLAGQTLVFDGVHWLPHAKASTIAKLAHEWLDSYDETTGEFTQSQPAFTDISGVATVAQIPSLPESQIIGLTADLASKAPLVSAALTGSPTINGKTPAVLDGPATQNFLSPAVGQAGIAVQRKTSGEATQMLGVVNETNTGWVASINGDGTVVGTSLKLTGSTTASSATAGAASALPATPEGYVEIPINGTTFKLPYYKV